VRTALGRTFTVAVTVAVGLLVLSGFFVRNPFLHSVQATILDWTMILAAVALLLGALNVAGSHMKRVWSFGEGWLYSLVLVASALVVIVLGATGDPVGVAAAPVQWVFQHVQAPLQATLFALLAFFVASAAYRVLRVRSWTSLLLVTTVLLVLVGSIPQSAMLWGALPGIKEWILQVPTTAGARGILIGASLGAVVTGLRVLLGMDRPHVR
jgi:hypothetical protein